MLLYSFIQLDIKVGGTDGNTTDIKKESDAFEKIYEKVEYMLETDENVPEGMYTFIHFNIIY